MRDYVYLIFDSRGVRNMVKRQPSLRSGQYAVKVKVEVKDSFFSQPIPEVEITLDGSDNPQPEPGVEKDDAYIGLDDVPDPAENWSDQDCPETADNHGVTRHCTLKLGHEEDHLFNGSAGPFRRPVRAV